MLTPDQLLGFLLAAVLVTISPGPDNLMVLSFVFASFLRVSFVICP